MTYEEIMAAKYAGTAFAILFETKQPPPPPTKAEIARERGRLNSERANKLRAKLRAAKNKAEMDNKRKANWTI